MTTKVRPEPTIPDHTVYRKIGGGAYGEVWLAEGVTGALRAVKVVWHDDFDDERGFVREFEGIEKYEPISRDHPGLVQLLHVGRGESEGEAFYYYVMELGDDVETGREINPVEYEARTLRSDMLRADKKPLDVDFCIEVGRELAEGLDHLHQEGLAHRDVKPANIIFVEGKAKLADIGLVALRDQRTFVGTEGFVPPEGPGSAQADVYSLGKVLYEMATGKDRLDFPELPDELPHGGALKRWRLLNAAICEVCEPRLSKRTIDTAGALAREMERLQLGKRRPLRVSFSSAMAILGVVLAVLLTWQFPNISSALSASDPIPAPPPEVVPDVSVTVTSVPTGAEVYDAEGKYITDTPLDPLMIPLGSKLEYLFRLDGYHPKKYTATITADLVGEGKSLIIAPTLEVYAPPVDQDPWEDVFGATYKGVGNYHISNYYVGKAEWLEYRQETGDTAGVMVGVSENGVAREVAFCLEQEAQRFSEWLEGKSQDGYLTADHEMEPQMDLESAFEGLSKEVVQSGVRPFRMVVRRIPYARLMFTSNPSGADVYLDGHWRGVTPLLGDDPVGSGIKVNPDAVELILEREGFERERRELSLKNDEVWGEPMHFALRQSAGVIFGRDWTNSLGMKLVPLNDDLMVSIWETRVKDYQEYVITADANRPRRPEFPQGDEHPVVYVSPDDARHFCAWLTEVERRQGLIAANHYYRLPTDREWSEMAGLSEEPGDWPVERVFPLAGEYPWGEAWPPIAGFGNFSDDSAVTDGAQPINKSIVNYRDGFAYTAPVGESKPNKRGVYDLGGNVHEWIEEDYALGEAFSVTRGGGWNSYQKNTLDFSFRNAVSQEVGVRDNVYGFRVVLAKEALVLEGEGFEIKSEKHTD